MTSDTNAELRSLLTRLRSGGIPEGELYSTLHRFGNARFLEARRDVEAFLTHPEASLRYIALNVLTLHWGCVEHRTTCERFAIDEGDPDNRSLGAACLGSLAQGTRDPRALKLLLDILENGAEDWHVRAAAYRAILSVLGRPASEQPSAARRLDFERDVSWERVQEARHAVEMSRRDRDAKE
jgi:hypothetical protein